MAQKLSCKHGSTVRRARRTDRNFTSVNEHATLDGVVYFFALEFTKLLTLQETLLIYIYIFFCGEHVPYTADTTFFLKVSEKG